MNFNSNGIHQAGMVNNQDNDIINSGNELNVRQQQQLMQGQLQGQEMDQSKQQLQQLHDQSEQILQDQGMNMNQQNEKKGRRTRTDPNNRNYICGCGKSYLSYPALYTHIKQKHDGKQPEDTKKPEKTRGQRGRPTTTSTQSAGQNNNFEQDNDNTSTDSNDSLNVIEELVLYIFSMLNKDVSIILSENSSNSLADMRAAFPVNIFENSTDYTVIQETMSQIYNNEGYIDEEQLEGTDDDTNNGVVQTKCNLVFGLFIYSIGKHLKDYALKEIVFYCCLFRKALNEYGWKILQDLGINVQGRIQQIENNANNRLPEFCEYNSAQHVLEISNEFITDILPGYLTKYQPVTSEFRLITIGNLNNQIIKITQHFCSWLYAKKYTNSVLETNDEDFQA